MRIAARSVNTSVAVTVRGKAIVSMYDEAQWLSEFKFTQKKLIFVGFVWFFLWVLGFSIFVVFYCLLVLQIRRLCELGVDGLRSAVVAADPLILLSE